MRPGVLPLAFYVVQTQPQIRIRDRVDSAEKLFYRFLLVLRIEGDEVAAELDALVTRLEPGKDRPIAEQVTGVRTSWFSGPVFRAFPC